MEIDIAALQELPPTEQLGALGCCWAWSFVTCPGCTIFCTGTKGAG